jgi:hypothetical protein
MEKTYTEIKSWETLKQEGSQHYKTGGVEPIDLYRAGLTEKILNKLV